MKEKLDLYSISDRGRKWLFDHSLNILFTLLLSFCFPAQTLFAQVDDEPTVRVGFFGVSTENIETHYAEDINNRFLRRLTRFDAFEVLNPADWFEIKPDIQQQTLENIIPGIAEEHNLDFALGGKLRHTEENGSNRVLRGRLFRYDRADDRFYFLNVHRPYIDLDEELTRFQDQFVNPIIPAEKSSTNRIMKWTFIAVGSAIVIGGSIYLYNSISSGGETTSPSPRPAPFY